MSFGTMFTIFFTWLFQSWGISIKPLPTALLALPFGIIATMILALVMDKTVYRYHRENKSSNVIFLIVSIGTMFVIGGIVRFAIGRPTRFFDGTRFLMKAREFKEMTGLREGMAIKMTQAITIVTAVIVVALSGGS